ncbi:MAG TPA: hypothetical protein VIZ22_03385 [Candidatus Limnocylindrales bacterium]
MSARRDAMSDLEIDGLLRALILEGSNATPTGMTEAALSRVARTAQARSRGATLRSVASAVGPAWALAAAVVLAVGLGVFLSQQGNGPMTSPSPGPSASPTQSAPPSSPSSGQGLVTVGSVSAGYELTIPASWKPVSSGGSDAQRWLGTDGDVMVSYGSSIFDGGDVTVCAPPAAGADTCTSLRHGYLAPFDPAVDGVGPISVEVWLDRCDGRCPITETEVTLDGERAAYTRAWIGDRQVTYVSTFHDRRPVIVYWSEPVELADEARILDMLASFRFRSAAPEDASPTPVLDPSEPVVYTNVDDGYEITMPRSWADATSAGDSGVRWFGTHGGFGTFAGPPLIISVGSPKGAVTVCNDSAFDCGTATATTLDELDAAIHPVPEQFASAVRRDKEGTLKLGGEPGRYERPGYAMTSNEVGIGKSKGGNCLGCPGLRYLAYTIHESRPVVLSIDWWTIGFERVHYDDITDMINSFRFLD